MDIAAPRTAPSDTLLVLADNSASDLLFDQPCDVPGMNNRLNRLCQFLVFVQSESDLKLSDIILLPTEKLLNDKESANRVS